MSVATDRRWSGAGDAGIDETVVTFEIGRALFALPVAPVMEIHEARDLAPLPKAPPQLLGLMDRRGFSVPVIDMRLLLGAPPREDAPETRIIALRVTGRGGTLLTIGLRVDRVIEVTQLDEAGSGPLAEAELLRWNERMVAGIGRRHGAFVTRIDVGGLFEADLAGIGLEEAAGL